jgi:hypothetical protein
MLVRRGGEVVKSAASPRASDGRHHVKYILAMIGDETKYAKMSPEEVQADVDRIEAFNKELTDAGAMVSGEGLDERTKAKTVRPGGDVSDGPYTDATDQLVGFWLIEAASDDKALEWAKKVPLDSGAVEVRPLVG